MANHTTFAVREDTEAAFSRTVHPDPKLAVLVPTRNEAANIEELLRRISSAVVGIPTEAGESKGSLREGLTYLGALGDLRLGREIPSAPRPVVGAAELERLAPLTGRTGTVRA